MCLTLSQKPERMNELIGTVFRFLWYYRVTVFTVVVDNIYSIYIYTLSCQPVNFTHSLIHLPPKCTWTICEQWCPHTFGYIEHLLCFPIT